VSVNRDDPIINKISRIAINTAVLRPSLVMWRKHSDAGLYLSEYG